MTWTIGWDDRLQAVRVQIAGIFNAPDYQAMIEEGLAQAFWTPGSNALLDYRACNLNRGFEVMLSAASVNFTNDSRIGNGRAAVVVASRSHYGSARQFYGITDSAVAVRMQPFLSLDAAEAWLMDQGDTD